MGYVFPQNCDSAIIKLHYSNLTNRWYNIYGAFGGSIILKKCAVEMKMQVTNDFKNELIICYISLLYSQESYKVLRSHNLSISNGCTFVHLGLISA